MTATSDTSVGEIVSGDFRAAAVFQRFGIDFCCGGRRALSDACRDRNVNVLDVLAEVERVCAPKDAVTPQFSDWGPDALVAYIVRHHHAYVRRILPALLAHTRKVAASHGATHSELKEIATLFEDVAGEMTAHMAREEQILFPYIDGLAMAARLGEPAPVAPFGCVDAPIRMMEHEHESAGQAMARIRDLSEGFTPPDGACMTYTVCFRELEAFERDLQVHVHLENNVLFPKARALESSADRGGRLV